MDPTAGQINLYATNPPQGLQQDMSIETTDEGTLTVPASGVLGKSEKTKQKDVILRKMLLNSGTENIITTINYPRSHQW